VTPTPELPPLPDKDVWLDSEIQAYARAAIISDRAARVPSDAEILNDFTTHRAAWRKAIEIALLHAHGKLESEAHITYWQHELETYDRSKLALDRALLAGSAAPAPMPEPKREPCAGKNCGSTTDVMHSAECFAEHEACIAQARAARVPSDAEAIRALLAGSGELAAIGADIRKSQVALEPELAQALYNNRESMYVTHEVVTEQFRKKPVVITARQWFKNGDHPLDAATEMFDYPNGQRPAVIREGAVVRYYRHPDVPGDKPCEQCGKPHHVHGWIDTLEQGHRVCPGDWIITGVKGERYPCKPDIFEATYEPAAIIADQTRQAALAAEVRATPLVSPQVKPLADALQEHLTALAGEFREAIPTQNGKVLAALIDEGVTVLASHIKCAVSEPALLDEMRAFINLIKGAALYGGPASFTAQRCEQMFAECARLNALYLAAHESVVEPVEQPLTDEQITEISSGYADGIANSGSSDWSVAFNACAFGMGRRAALRIGGQGDTP